MVWLYSQEKERKMRIYPPTGYYELSDKEEVGITKALGVEHCEMCQYKTVYKDGLCSECYELAQENGGK